MVERMHVFGCSDAYRFTSRGEGGAGGTQGIMVFPVAWGIVRSPSVLCTARCLMAPADHLHHDGTSFDVCDGSS
jgi:hypothetical protein